MESTLSALHLYIYIFFFHSMHTGTIYSGSFVVAIIRARYGL